jgi:nitrilase
MTFDDLLKRAANRTGIRPYIAACVQAAPVAFDVAKTLVKVRDFAADASRQRAKLAVFPEAFVSAYPRGMDFGAVIGARSAEGREAFRRYHASSIDVPGPVVDTLGAIAREFALHLVIGVIERDGGTLYCATLTFNDEGALIGKRRNAASSCQPGQND